ncbi:hypothetical protein [Metabacillus sp. FJAT-53654]|uniref:Uncharacterized protein n=1 Tax=Metabacillus rhizosphaerae TaxID=3117747 RepID=A0ABZ2MW83_9BACI
MPLVQLKEMYTPLRLFGIKLFKCKQDGKRYIKMGKKSVKRMFA